MWWWILFGVSIVSMQHVWCGTSSPGASQLHNLFSRESPDKKMREEGMYPRSQTMLMFIDDSEIDISSVTTGLAIALYQPCLLHLVT